MPGRENRAPALIGSALLHAAVFGAAFIALPFGRTAVKELNSVPITIVSSAPPELSRAVEAPVAQQATAPEVAPEVQPETAPPPPAPAPAPVPEPKTAPPPPKPTPTPRPAPKPLDLAALASSLPQTKAPAKTAAKPLDLAALASSLPKHATAATKGPSHPPANLAAIAGPPRPLSGDDLSALTAKLIRLWNPNCTDETGAKAVVRVEMRLTPDGRLAGPPSLVDRPIIEAGGPVLVVSAQRALVAVQRGEPYTELPRDRYDAWKDIIVRFNAKQACAGT